VNGDSGVRKQPPKPAYEHRYYIPNTYNSKATRCPQSDILLYFRGIYLVLSKRFIILKYGKISNIRI